MQNGLPLLLCFNKQIILEGSSIILEFNYFYTDRIYIHQIKGTAVDSNLVVAYEKIKMFALLPQLYPEDLFEFFLRNYLWILDNVFHKWLENFDIEPFYNMINNLDLDLKRIVKNPFKSLNFLDINLQIVDNNIVFDIYYKPSNSFNCLTYRSCYPLYTKNNKLLSLAKRIV